MLCKIVLDKYAGVSVGLCLCTDGFLHGVLLLKVFVVGFFKTGLSPEGEHYTRIYLLLFSYEAVLLAVLLWALRAAMAQ